MLAEVSEADERGQSPWGRDEFGRNSAVETAVSGVAFDAERRYFELLERVELDWEVFDHGIILVRDGEEESIEGIVWLVANISYFSREIKTPTAPPAPHPLTPLHRLPTSCIAISKKLLNCLALRSHLEEDVLQQRGQLIVPFLRLRDRGGK